MKKPKQKPLAPPMTITGCHFTNNHPPLPDGHVAAVERIATACEELAKALGTAARALKGPDNNSIGLQLKS